MSPTQRHTLRPLAEVSELVLTERIQSEVWGIEDHEVVPASLLRAAVHAGGHVIGAFESGALIGFAFGILATPHGTGMEGLGVHSHMVAVLPEYRRHGLGKRLKWFQRRWCLERDLRWMSWTFDPLQAKNANLNLRHLGVECHDYLVDFYGPMPGSLGGGQPSDRLLALWLLDSPQVTSLAAGRPVVTSPYLETTGPAPAEMWLLTRDMVEDAVTAGGDQLAAVVASKVHDLLEETSRANARGGSRPAARVAVPEDATALLAHDPQRAELWRTGVRAALAPLLDGGMHIAAFHNAAYTVVNAEQRESGP